jgi:hypothetical protein
MQFSHVSAAERPVLVVCGACGPLQAHQPHLHVLSCQLQPGYELTKIEQAHDRRRAAAAGRVRCGAPGVHAGQQGRVLHLLRHGRQARASEGEQPCPQTKIVQGWPKLWANLKAK